MSEKIAIVKSKEKPKGGCTLCQHGTELSKNTCWEWPVRQLRCDLHNEIVLMPEYKTCQKFEPKEKL